MKGTISIGRWHGRGIERPIRIQVTDEASGVEFLTVEMTLSDFAEAIFGLGRVPMEFTIYHPELIGWKAESKTEQIEIPAYGGRFENGVAKDKKAKAVVAAVQVHEVDGWKARMSDAFNHHRVISTDHANNRHLISMVFFRHVHPETGEPKL